MNHRIDRKRRSARLVLLASALGLAGCKAKIPKEWQDVVPTEGLRKAYASEGNPVLGDPPGLMAFYERDAIDALKLRANFRAKALEVGYELVFECTGRPEHPADGYVKAPGTFLDFSSAPLTADTWNVRLQRSDKVLSAKLPKGDDCRWLTSAAKYCGGQPDGERCTLQK